jgi:hypothetical protein
MNQDTNSSLIDQINQEIGFSIRAIRATGDRERIAVSGLWANAACDGEVDHLRSLQGYATAFETDPGMIDFAIRGLGAAVLANSGAEATFRRLLADSTVAAIAASAERLGAKERKARSGNQTVKPTMLERWACGLRTIARDGRP